LAAEWTRKTDVLTTQPLCNNIYLLKTIEKAVSKEAAFFGRPPCPSERVGSHSDRRGNLGPRVFYP
jgi:hypothetical protein